MEEKREESRERKWSGDTEVECVGSEKSGEEGGEEERWEDRIREA